MFRSHISAVALLATSILAGCMSPAQIQSASTPRLAREYGQYGSRAVEQELRTRAVFTDEQWGRIKSGRIAVGDDMNVVSAALGLGWEQRKVTMAGGTRRCLKFESASTAFRPVLVYTENDRVVAIEE